MNRILFGLVLVAVLTAPAFASDFSVERAKALDAIQNELQQPTITPARLDELNAARLCLEGALNTKDLQACLDKFHSPAAATQEN